MKRDPDYRVYFFLPLPEALSVPEQPYLLDLESPMAGAGSVTSRLSKSPRMSPGSISVFPRHVWVDETELTESSSVVLEMMPYCVPWAMQKANWFARGLAWVRHRRAVTPKTIRTVVEVSAIMPPGWRPYSAATEEEFDPQLEYVLNGAAEAINQLHDLDYTFTKRAKSAITPRAWPVLLHFAFGVCVDGEMRRAPEGSIGIFYNAAAAEAHDLRRRHEADETINSDLLDYAARTPFEKVLQLMRESDALVHISGSDRAALVLTAATCESLLDMTLMFLLWESGKPPETSAQRFKYPRSTLQRVRSDFSGLLGGSWDTTKVPELRHWVESVVHPRNQVLHFGLRVNRLVANEAWAAFNDLRHLLANRLWNRFTSYPFTTVTYFRALGMLPPPDELDGSGLSKLSKVTALPDAWAFERWIHCLQALISDRDRLKPSTSSGGLLAVVRGADGSRFWLWHDWFVGMACLVKPPANLEEKLSGRIEEHPVMGYAAAYSFTEEAALTPLGDWVEEHCLVPGLQVSANGSDLTI